MIVSLLLIVLCIVWVDIVTSQTIQSRKRGGPWKKWIVGYVPVVIPIAIVALGELRPEPLSREEFQQFQCKWEPYLDELLKASTANSTLAMDSARIREQAECLSRLSESTLDSALVDIGTDRLENATVRLKYLLLTPQLDSAARSELFLYLGLAADKRLSFMFPPNPWWMPELIDAWKIAAIHYDSSIAYDRSNEWAWFRKGLALYQLGRPEESLHSLDNAISIKYDFADSWYHRVFPLGSLGRDLDIAATCDSAAKYDKQRYGWAKVARE